MSMHAAFAAPAPMQEARRRLDEARLKDDIIAIVRSAARGDIGDDGVTIEVRDGEQSHYVEEAAIGPLRKGKRFPLARCISGWAMLHDETVAISDIFIDKRIPHDAYRPTFVKSLIMAPVRVEAPVAAIGAYWKDRRAFTPEDVKNVEMMAAFVGKALRRVAG